MRLTRKSRNRRRLEKALSDAKRGNNLDVGVLGPVARRTHTDSELSVAAIASMHEFGLGVPRRSFLVDWFNQNLREVKKILDQELAKVARGELTHDQALDRVGAWAVGEIQARISDGIDPENSPETIARKGSSTPLIDTGQLRQSIVWALRK